MSTRYSILQIVGRHGFGNWKLLYFRSNGMNNALLWKSSTEISGSQLGAELGMWEQGSGLVGWVSQAKDLAQSTRCEFRGNRDWNVQFWRNQWSKYFTLLESGTRNLGCKTKWDQWWKKYTYSRGDNKKKWILRGFLVLIGFWLISLVKLDLHLSG